MKKTVLVTGGAGYIGSHTCKLLAQNGYTPVTYDSLITGHRWAVQWGPLIEADMLDRTALANAMDEYRPAAVMHFAASAYVGESMIDPGKYYRNNVVGSLNLLETMRDAGVPHLVFSSTCATYGVPDTCPIPEHHPQRPVNPYGTSKLMVENMVRDFSSAHGLRAISLRYFNAAGADPEGQLGETHDPETHLIPLALDAAAGTGPALTVFGDGHPTPDGTCVRDYVHVSDLAHAHLLALQALMRGHEGCAFNVGNGSGYSVRQVIDVTSQVTGRSVPFAIGPARAGDPPRLVGDASRIRAELAWEPRHPGIREMIESAWRWHQRKAA